MPASRPLPLLTHRPRCGPETCRWKCGDECAAAPSNVSGNEPFADVVARGLSRRDFLRGIAASVLVVGYGGMTATDAAAQTGDRAHAAGTTLRFEPIAPTNADTVVVPRGYDHQVLIRWGDPLLEGAPEWDADAQTGAAQALQFGFNNDFVAYWPLRGSDEGLVWVNHEYTNPELMFHGYDGNNPTEEQVLVDIMAHGGSIVHVRRPRRSAHFQVVRPSPYNRRITGTTPMEITGPARGHELMRTNADPSGTEVLGMLNNCAGGTTPWGTVLTCEENFHQYFAHLAAADVPERVRRMHQRVNIPNGQSQRKWERFHERFDLRVEPHEPFRFGWVVEIDPYDPSYKPRKRTALGRFKREGATTRLTADGRVAVYSGDDSQFEYLYKFVTAGRFDPDDMAATRDLLDEGTLYAARFYIDENGNGFGEWLPLVFGEGPLTPENGFNDQAEVLMNARLAADAVGATPMDRPEDVQPSPVTGRVYAALTNNTARSAPNAPNPRAPNRWGHVLEWEEDGGDAAATTFRWQFFLLCGNPNDPSTSFAGFPKELVSPISSPDNLLFDHSGNIWIATDGQPTYLGPNDAFHAVPLKGRDRGHVRQFLSVPVGAEACGPELTPDERTLFCAVQHPGEGSTADNPSSDWPDRAGLPRPSLVTIAKQNTGRIGS